MKSIRKKSTRFSVQLSNMLGLSSHQVADENFFRVETEYRSMEKSVKAFANDLNSFLIALKVIQA